MATQILSTQRFYPEYIDESGKVFFVAADNVFRGVRGKEHILYFPAYDSQMLPLWYLQHEEAQVASDRLFGLCRKTSQLCDLRSGVIELLKDSWEGAPRPPSIPLEFHRHPALKARLMGRDRAFAAEPTRTEGLAVCTSEIMAWEAALPIEEGGTERCSLHHARRYGVPVILRRLAGTPDFPPDECILTIEQGARLILGNKELWYPRYFPR